MQAGIADHVWELDELAGLVRGGARSAIFGRRQILDRIGQIGRRLIAQNTKSHDLAAIAIHEHKVIAIIKIATSTCFGQISVLRIRQTSDVLSRVAENGVAFFMAAWIVATAVHFYEEFQTDALPGYDLRETWERCSECEMIAKSGVMPPMNPVILT